MNLTLHVWRQQERRRSGPIRNVSEAKDIRPDMSFLEMLDQVNEQLAVEGQRTHRLRVRLP